MFRKSLIILIICITPEIFALAKDSVYVNNGNLLVGEIKGMDRGVLTIETDYSDKDFKVEWDAVKEIYSQRLFIITTKSGNRYYGTIMTDSSDKNKIIVLENRIQHSTNLRDIVFIDQVDEDFLSRLSASFDLGFSFAKTNNLVQFSVRTNLGYLTDAWSVNVSYSGVRSSQDEVEPTKRNEGSVSFRYFLPDDWFVFASNSLLQNDEQKLKLRSITQAGLGNFIVRTNSMYLAAVAGAAWNNETYTDSAIGSRSSSEGVAGLEFNIFNLGDLDFLTSLMAYPSLSERGRIRTDYKFDLKYEFPIDIYISLGFTINYDNKPVEGASESDYVIQTSIGWEL